MPTFRQRPLTWLFWIATACADIVGFVKYPDGLWIGPLLYGQLHVICGWAAVSEANRLGRAAFAVTAPLAIALFVYPRQRAPDEVPFVLALSLAAAASVFFATRVLTIFVRALPGQRRVEQGRKWQISIAEMLGWMIVTAIVSWSTTLSKMPPLELIAGIGALFVSPIPTAVMIGGFLAPRVHRDGAAFIATIVTLAAFAALISAWGGSQMSGGWLFFAAMYAYVAGWILVTRLDQSSSLKEPEGSLAVDDPSPVGP